MVWLKPITGAFVWVLALLSVTAHSEVVYKIERMLNVHDAQKLEKQVYGIKANAGNDRKIEVRMYTKDNYHSGGRSDKDGLLYGVYANENKSNYQHQNWEITYDHPCSTPVLGKWECTWSWVRSQKQTSTNYKGRLMNIIKRFQHEHPVLVVTGVRVIVELEFHGTSTLADVEEIHLPGVALLKSSDFVTYHGDFSALFNRGNEVTVVAHRGYWEERGVVQNSLAAIDAANAITGLDWIELDIRSTQDMHPILFHDDKPQKILQEVQTDFPAHPDTSVYDFPWGALKAYDLYDRFNTRSAEKLLDLDSAFRHISANNIVKPINMDIGIPDDVPQGWDHAANKKGKVKGKPFFDAVFLKAVDLACRYGLSNRVIFKGKYTADDPIWAKVDSILLKKYVTVDQHKHASAPKIAYTPKLGDDIKDSLVYFNKWVEVKEGQRLIPGVELVGMEIRLKNDQDIPINTFLKRAIADAHDVHLKVGVFSEAPSTCQGYWTKSALEKYIYFKDDKRNSFEWLLSNKYDYIITDFPKNLIELRTKRAQHGVHN